jgi:E3 ubiquitin-protein ligase MARCH6
MFTLTPNRTPLGSPSLATYRAPEELSAESGPSKVLQAFDAPSQAALAQEDNSAFKGKLPQTLTEAPSDSPINNPQAGLEFPLAMETQLKLDATGEEPPQSFSSGSSFGDSQSKPHRNHSETSPYFDDDPLRDLDPEYEMSHYFDGDDEDTLVSSVRPDSPQVEDPGPTAEAQDHEGEAELRREDDDDDDEEPDEDGDELLWNGAPWDGIEVEEVPDIPDQNVEEGGPQPDANPAQANGRGDQAGDGEGGVPQDIADDLEGNVEDDMEGAMEG